MDRDGDRITVNAGVGSNLLDVAIDNDIELEGITIFSMNKWLNFIFSECHYVSS